ncbi:MAG: tRNA pseudouridine(55) synthase TruB [Flavobacteriales bacterium]|jgi:tRNA pseudouridine55 synthase|nr:tRNA pseudouridine(55) synthase TruB [Flavobacteriales bacterium]MDC0908554.1 tRNA pseudouridine(55) synthase TruB [Flavobacteriales bacterium]MDC3390295.1 tRNA pseudouridine(55) synthase TruB [Flavobacteriales bacterium]
MNLFQISEEKFLEGQMLLIEKPIGWSSFDVVKKIKYLIRKRYNLKKIKVGHAGTLDPLASGLLIICTGKFTKKISEIQDKRKIYTGIITLGGTTPSFDLETEIEKNYKTDHISEDLIKKTTTKFLGEINQVPPIFSALKKDGERLYEKARRGEKIKINSRKVTIYKFESKLLHKVNVHFIIECSKGTYIRSIANDLGAALNCGGYLSKLCRTDIGEFSLSNAMSINSFEDHINT